MDSSICKYSQNYSLIDSSADISWLIKGNDLFFEFENPKLTTHRRVPLSIQVFFGKKGTEEHDSQETFDHYRVKVFFQFFQWSFPNMI